MSKTVHAALSPLRKYSAVLLLMIGLSLSYLFISIQFWSVVGPILGVAIGAAIAGIGSIYAYFRVSEGPTRRTKSNALDIRIPLILTSAYVVGMILLLRSVNYYRPPLLYVLFGGYTAVVGYQIARGESRRRIVPQMLILAFFIYWSSQMLFPAGMYDPDTVFRYVPSITSTLASGEIPAADARYGGHLGYVAMFTLLGGASVQQSYFFLATLVLVGTILLIVILDKILPVINQSVALYAALIFCTTSWMLGRGMHPNKLNFFYPLILLLGLSAFSIYQSETRSLTETRSWFLIGFLAGPAVVFGHRFSAGAALVFLFSIGTYVLLSRTALAHEYEWVPYGSVLPFIGIYALQVIGNPFHQGPLMSRLLGLVTAAVVSDEATQTAGGGGGGPGRYSSQIPLETLFVSTSAQTILFALAVIGAIWMFKRSEWEYDLLIFWMGVISVLLIISLVNNTADTAPQRFYALLTLFGFNVCAAVVLYRLSNASVLDSGYISVNFGSTSVAVLLGIFAVASLASPIADTVTSPAGDDIPHFKQFDTAQQIQSEQWAGEYGQSALEITGPNTNIPIEQTGATTGEADLSSIPPNIVIVYSNLVSRTGVAADGGLTIGGREFVFIDSPQRMADDQIYTNGESEAFIRSS